MQPGEEVSIEAAVAGEAAAAAVEEVHARETVVEAASAAVETSAMAAEGSLEALEASQSAEQAAAEARAEAEAAAAVAAGTANAVVETSDYARTAHETALAARQDVAELRTLFENFVNRVTAPPEQPESAVQEVPVNAPQTHTPEESASDGGNPVGESGESATGRRRLRRLSR